MTGLPETFEQDLRKIHNEATQIANQRFQVTTLAAIIFVTVCGWLTSAMAAGGSANKLSQLRLLRVTSLMVLGFLVILFLYQFILFATLRKLTVYLKIKGSIWEADWQKFRSTGRPYWAYSKGAALLFCVLGLGAFSYPLVLQLIFLPQTLVFDHLFFIAVIGLLIQLAITVLMTVARGVIVDEGKIERNWKEALGFPSEPNEERESPPGMAEPALMG